MRHGTRSNVVAISEFGNGGEVASPDVDVDDDKGPAKMLAGAWNNLGVM